MTDLLPAETLVWQPIETAPKGEILLYHPPTKNRGFGISALIRVGYKGDWPMRRATHWAKLPEPPK